MEIGMMIEKRPTSEVMNVDCLEYMRSLPDKHFDLCIADPPYRDVNSPTEWMKKKQSNDKLFLLGVPSEEVFKEMERVSKAQIIWGANNFNYPFKGFIAWDKQVRGSSRYSQIEIASLSENLSTVSRYCSFSCYDTQGKIHPTQKPIDLYAWILKNYAHEGDKIFDPFLGSGSSRIAAYKLGFDFVGCEIDEEYFRLSEERFQRECHGIVKSSSEGTTLQQLSLF